MDDACRKTASFYYCRNSPHHRSSFYCKTYARRLMVNAIESDIIITWLAAIGTGIYFFFLWTRQESSPAIRATEFLMGTLTVLLSVRGFFWLYGGDVLGKIV